LGTSLNWLAILGFPASLVFMAICTLYVLSLDRYPSLESKFNGFLRFGEKHPFLAKIGIAVILVFVWYGFLSGFYAFYGFLPLFLLYILMGALAILQGIFTVGFLEYFINDWNMLQTAIAIMAATMLFLVLRGVLFP